MAIKMTDRDFLNSDTGENRTALHIERKDKISVFNFTPDGELMDITTLTPKDGLRKLYERPAPEQKTIIPKDDKKK